MAENTDAVDEAIIKFDDDESLAKNKKDPVEDEVKTLLKGVDDLIKVIEKIAPEINSDKVVNPEAFLKVLKPLSVSVENSLPMLWDKVDALEYLHDDNAYVLRQKIARIEDELLPPILDYIFAHEKK